MYSIKIEPLLKMMTHSGFENYNVILDITLGKDTLLHNFNIAGRVGKRFNAGEALEAIFADGDSSDENFDFRSDIKYVPNSENKSASKESDLDESIALPNRSYNESTEKVSEAFAGNFSNLKQ